MKVNKIFKSKTQMIIYSIITIICIALFIIISKTDFNKNITTDTEKFASLYDLVTKDNLYKFASAGDVYDIVEGKSGVILMGFPTNKWTNYYAYFLNDVAMEIEVKEILYYDFLQDREESNGTYSMLVNKLNTYVRVDDEGNLDIKAPTVLIVKNGVVIGYFDDTSIMRGIIKPEDYYTDYQINLTKEGFKTALKEYIR